jgi:hypothetical protein
MMQCIGLIMGTTVMAKVHQTFLKHALNCGENWMRHGNEYANSRIGRSLGGADKVVARQVLFKITARVFNSVGGAFLHNYQVLIARGSI